MRLEDICTVFTDGDWIESKDQSEEGIRLVQTGNIGEGIYLEKESRAKYISEETFKRMKCTEIFPGDILVSRLPDPVGRACIVPEKKERMVTAVDCTICRPNKSLISKEYMCYFMRSNAYYTRLMGNIKGATRKRISRKNLGNIELNVPSKEEQLRGVKQLDCLTKVINSRRKEIELLDNLIKARFIELFGKETEFDKWPCGTVGDVADVCVGVVIKPTQYYTDEGTPAFRSLNIGEMYVKNTDWVYFTEEGHRKNQKSVIRKNDVLVVRSGAPGTACVATEKYDGYNAVDIIIAHPDKNKVNSVFLAAFTNMPHGMNQIRVKTGGAAQQHFNVGGYKNMRLILPPMKLQEEFATFVQGVDKSKVITAVPFVFRFAPYSCRAVALCVCVHTCALASKLSCTCMSHPRTACRNTQIPFC